MTVKFGTNRLVFYVVVFLLSGVVLGLGSHFVSIFAPTAHTGFGIFTIVVSALNIFIFLLALQWSKPKHEATLLFVFAVLWLAMGAWSTDIIGHVQCDILDERMETKTGTISAKTWCQEMKVIQAFSWALFALFVMAFYILIQLVGQAIKMGRHHIWKEPIRELPWFGEMPGYYNTHPQAMPFPSPHGAQGGGYPISPYPPGGGALMIQPNLNGAPPTITQVPLSAVPFSA